MGTDKIRHLVTRESKKGDARYYWQPSRTIAALGLSPESLGTEYDQAKARAVELNNLADEVRRGREIADNGPRPGSFSRLVADYKDSDEYGELKPRTQRDYAYYADKIEAAFGSFQVRAITAPAIKVFYKRISRERGRTFGYHVLATLRTVLSWGASEGWINDNPALLVKLKAPQKRKIVWKPEQTQVYIDKAKELGWHSIVAMAHVFDSIGQSPVDVRTLLRKSYDGRTIDVSRAKTGVEGAPIPLFPDAVAALNSYLATQPAKLPDAPLFTNDKIGGMWNESTLGKTHRKIRAAAGLPSNLQLQDFRTSMMTEGGAAGATTDELRGIARHTTRSAAENYVFPDTRYTEAGQSKRLALRNKKAEKVGTVSD